MSKTSSFIAILIAAVGGFAVGHMTGKSGAGEETASVVDEASGLGEPGAAVAEAGDHQRFRIPVTSEQPSKGPADALVTIVEFSEFECPFCARVLPTTQKILDEYGDKVRIVWRNNPLPFHKNAGPAAELAMEAYAQGGADKFWDIHDVLFANQRQLTRENLERFAKEAGLDMAKVKKALDSGTHEAAIKADQELAAKIGARGTPNFFINGRQLVGAQPFPKFKEVIDDEIQRAEKLLEKGTDKKDVYATLLRGGAESAAAAKPDADRPQPSRPDPAAVYKLEIAGNEPQKGPSDALVTVVEVSDFQCPFCARVNPTLKKIREEYGDDVRVVWWNNPLPFHKQAGPAAAVALEAHAQGGDAKFWAMHDKIFANQKQINRENLLAWSKEIGLDVGKVEKALDSGKYDEVIKSQQQKAAQFGARGTPAFFINGRLVTGARPYEAFKSVIDEELARAKKIVEGGTPRARVYAEAVKNGETKPKTIGGGDAPQQPERPAPGAGPRYEIAIPAGAPSIGPKNAPVVIQEFSDYQCPFCARVLPTLDQIVETYGDKVRIVWRDLPLPFHKEASPAAQAAREVLRQGGEEKFWKYNKMLFDNQRELGRAKYEELAQQLGGINMAEFKKALDSERHKAAVDADLNAARQSGARIGTPAFFINGRLVSGAQSFQTFKSVIDDELEKSKTK